MKKSLVVFLEMLVISALLIGCTTGNEADKSSSLIEVVSDDLIYKATVSPNKEYTKKEEDIVYYNIEVYQEEDNSIIVNASSNSDFFKGLQYVVEYDKEISESDVNITWTTLMGNTEYTEDDNLAIAHVSLSENNEVFSERTINFVKGVMEIVTEMIERNK